MKRKKKKKKRHICTLKCVRTSHSETVTNYMYITLNTKENFGQM